MDFRSCITITMQVLEFMLENGWNLSNENNFNETTIKLKDNGFILEEEQRFNGVFTYGVREVAVSPLFVLRMLFDGDEFNKDLVTKMGGYVPEYKFNGAISYIEMVKFLNEMRNNDSKGLCKNCLDKSYFEFRKKYRNYKRDSYCSIKNQILSISNMKYEDLANLRVTREGIARKIERMYQVEKLLEDYCYKIALERKGIIDIYDDVEEIYDYKEECEKIDLASETIPWSEFCVYVRELNSNEIDRVNLEYRRERYQSDFGKLTVLGLDLLPLPASPISRKVYEKSNY